MKGAVPSLWDLQWWVKIGWSWCTETSFDDAWTQAVSTARQHRWFSMAFVDTGYKTWLGDRNGSPYAIGPLSVCPLLSVCDVGVLWPNGWMDQDETWHGVRPGPRQDYVRWGPSSPFHPKRGTVPRTFGPCLLWPNGWINQDATWYGGRPRPRRRCVRRGPSPPRQKKAQPPFFGPCLLWTNGWMDQDDMALAMEVGLSPCHIVLDGDLANPPKNI